MAYERAGLECDAVGQLLNNLGRQLVEILLSDDRWQLDVTAWLRNPSGVFKLYDLKVREPTWRPNSVDEDLPFTPDAPTPPTDRRTLIHHLTIRVLDVVDKKVPFMKLRLDFEPDDDEDLTRRHDYSRSWYRGESMTLDAAADRALVVNISVDRTAPGSPVSGEVGRG
uniref:Uncharacterized protein n=1 Tax=Hordeum vulgare subsp. vulgare TaxID=112509 RepID=A0A8I6XMV9_HORVV